MLIKRMRWLLVLVVLFLVVPTVASASVFGDAQYRKNKLYNLRTTIKSGTTTYGTFTQSLLARPPISSGGTDPVRAAEQLDVATAGPTDSNPITPVAGGDDQQAKLQNISNASVNPMLLNSHVDFEPAKSFGGLGYNLKTEVLNGSILYATNRLALLSNPFAAIFGNVFAGNSCESDSCRKLNFGQKGFGVSGDNLGGANFSYQIPGYAIQEDSILKWDTDNNYGNEAMEGVVASLLPTARRQTCAGGVTYTFPNLSFTGTDATCNIGFRNNASNSGSGVVVINGDFYLNGAVSPSITLRGVGTFIVKGNLYINKNITYDSANSSVGFIVLGSSGSGGTITIADGVNKVQGMFYAPGQIGKIVISQGSSKLLMKGIFATNTFELNKRSELLSTDNMGINEVTNSELKAAGINPTAGQSSTGNYNVAILYDPRIQKNPPPGFRYGITSASSGTQSLFEPAAP